MSVNKHRPHLFVLPEDDADRQLANGFALRFNTRQLYVLPTAGGWTRVRDKFVSEHLSDMQRHGQRLMILLVDFDRDEHRIEEMRTVIPADLSDRVFVLGVWSEPEALRQAGLGTFEEIGDALARDCQEGTTLTWGHDLLQHNEGELGRLRHSVCPILQ